MYYERSKVLLLLFFVCHKIEDDDKIEIFQRQGGVATPTTGSEKVYARPRPVLLSNNFSSLDFKSCHRGFFFFCFLIDLFAKIRSNS